MYFFSQVLQLCTSSQECKPYIFVDLQIKLNEYMNLFIDYWYIHSKNAGLNTTQRWVKYGWTQRLGCLEPAVGLLPRRLG